ncbi:MAG: bifunctional MaoC family dehydratase N-terminal/OB-fold nucleic acid binding domain-containing protein [Rubrivivax sp.]
MTPEETKEFEAKIRAFVGREISPPCKGADARVNEAMIRHWTEVTGDRNPVYTDAAFAAASAKKGIVAPPTMLQIWSMEGYKMCRPAGDQLDMQRQLHKVFDEHGFVGVLGTNTNTEFFRDLRPGDEITYHTVIDNISERKTTGRGVGYFIETITRFTDQHGQDVGRQVFRVLKFAPSAVEAKAKAEAKADSGGAQAPALPTRIQAPRGHDNAWWWEAIDQGRLMIQRCKACGTLRHPPRPMCGHCQSTQWDSIESSLEGEVFSFTELNYPRFPGYPYPLLCAVVQLREGTRLVANLAGCEPEQVHIGMKVKGKVERVDAKTVLPNFYPA